MGKLGNKWEVNKIVWTPKTADEEANTKKFELVSDNRVVIYIIHSKIMKC